jgi:hypothetical protein
MAVCDDFDRDDSSDLGEDWDTGFSALKIKDGELTNEGASGANGRYAAVEYDPDDHRVRVDVRVDETPRFISVILGLDTIGSGNGLYFIISSLRSVQASSESGAFSTNGVRLGGNASDFQTNFTMECAVNSTGGMTVTLSDFAEGSFESQNLIYDLGTYDNYELMGTQGGVYINTGSEGSVFFDNFAHTGCGTFSKMGVVCTEFSTVVAGDVVPLFLHRQLSFVS